jgi:hypothetical protein
MKKTHLAIFSFTTLICLTSFSSCSNRQEKEDKNLGGQYLGQRTPGLTPELFAPGVIATGFNERDIAFSPDGNELFYGLLTSRHITIMHTKLADGKWTEPEIAPFARDLRFYFLEPCFSPDGKTVYFLSTKPPAGKEPRPRWTYQNIWAADRQADGTWGEAYNPDSVLNRPNSQFYPSFAKSGMMYFTRTDASTGVSQVLRARKEANGFGEPELLPPVVNGNGNIYNAFIASDESYLIACVDNKSNTENPGYGIYYIFFRDGGDRWSEGVPFGPEINMKGSNAISASVSPDGKFLFFSAQSTSEEMKILSENPSLGSMLELLGSPGNGNYDIYWVSAEVIENLKNQVLPENR